MLSLFLSNCLPILSYGICCSSLSVGEIRSFSYAYNMLFCRLFKTNNLQSITYCQFFTYFFPFSAFYDFHRFNFLSSQLAKNQINGSNVLNKDDMHDLMLISAKYGVSLNTSKYQMKCKIWHFIANSVLQ